MEGAPSGGYAETHWSIVAGLSCLLASFLIGHALETRGFSYLPESAVGVILGITASAVAAATSSAAMLHDMRFNFEFFMTWLLPPIIFEAGFNMNRQAFFAHLFPTALFAFCGTLFSTAVVGALVFAGGAAGLCHPLGGLASLFFGALISATDPVTVLAVFQRLGVKADLFAMVFGESVLNDAVAIVLSRTLLGFQAAPFTPLSALLAVIMFVTIFVGSLLIGLAFGAASALLYKHADLRAHADAFYVEVAVIVTFAWGANYTAEAFELSGIVSILFCGIVMAKYTRDNMSEPAAVLAARAFKVVALLAESFVFVYLGMAAFSFPVLRAAHWRLVGLALLACALGRTHVYALSHVANRWRGSSAGFTPGPHMPEWARSRAPAWVANAHLLPDPLLPPISRTYQHVLLFSGLRGGVAFAIAAVAYERGEFAANGDALVVLQTTLMVALFTIFVLGGTVTDLAKVTGILETNENKGGERARRETLAAGTMLGEWERTRLRPFLTINPAADDFGSAAFAAAAEAEALLGTPRAAMLDARYSARLVQPHGSDSEMALGRTAGAPAEAPDALRASPLGAAAPGDEAKGLS